MDLDFDPNMLWDSTKSGPVPDAVERMLAKHRVLPWHNVALTTVCRPFDFSKGEPADVQMSLRTFILTMMYRMRIDRGMGLAANQIGMAVRILVIATQDYKQYMINPEIVEQSVETCEMEEGCLSFNARKPFRIKKTRPTTVMVSYYLIDGSKVAITLRGLEARVFFHEFDHLNGIRMIDSDNPEKVRYQIERLKKHQR